MSRDNTSSATSPSADAAEPECERCGLAPADHHMMHWCDNQSFRMPDGSVQLGATLTAPAPSAAEPVTTQDLPLVVTSAPDHIWLDLGFDPEWEGNVHFSNLEGVSWSEDNATGNGIEYVRADLAAPPAPQPTEAEPDPADIIAGALCTSRAHAYELMRSALKSEAPVAEPVPTGAIVNGRTYADNLEQTGLECIAGPLTLCNDWVEFRRCFEHLAHWAIGSQIGTSTVIPTPSAADPLKDHEIREVVSAVTKVAQQYGHTQQLRERIKGVLLPVLKRAPSAAEPKPGSVLFWMERSLKADQVHAELRGVQDVIRRMQTGTADADMIAEALALKGINDTAVEKGVGQ